MDKICMTYCLPFKFTHEHFKNTRVHLHIIVKYLGQLFSAKGMQPDHQKIATVFSWDTPKNVSELKGFLWLASYYQHYIYQFAYITALLNNFTNKALAFVWDDNCWSVFERHLIQVPVPTYPDFSLLPASFNYTPMQVGTVLEYGGKVVVYICKRNTEIQHNSPWMLGDHIRVKTLLPLPVRQTFLHFLQIIVVS